ncbi:MAG: flagellar hook assembly protein FlgD [Deltaproteobacteria bacterium]|jgi:flagellar basal-body rod modification protein FlgD|nr:flagellar hook assembly protein FlgD [Deltaproteobacteria bacterium]
MYVDSIAPAANGPPGIYDPGATSNTLGKDDFLTLLITQLQNQDPLNPADSTEYTAQLAQFSSLEQLNNVNKNLEYMQLYQASINNAQAVSFIGKEIISFGNEVRVTEGQAESCRFELGGDAGGVVVNIYDSAGSLVKAIEQGAMIAGRQTVVWDGTDQNGNAVSDGDYTFEVMAVDAADQKVEALTYSSGLVEGVTFIEGRTYFLVGNQKIPISDIVEVVRPNSSGA